VAEATEMEGAAAAVTAATVMEVAGSAVVA